MSSSPARRRRHSPAVYRRRRIVLLLVLIAVVAGIWALIAQPWRTDAAPMAFGATGSAAPLLPAVSSSPASSPTPTAPAPDATQPGSEASATPGTSALPTPQPSASAPPCSTDDIDVTAVTDSATYPSGQNPRLSIEVANTGSSACTLNVGSAAQVFTITSGSDTWWRSTDCQSEPSDMYVILAAGQKAASSEPIVWDRTRSSVATCQAGDRPQAPGGGATYHLSVSIGGIAAIDDAMFQLY